MSNPLIESLKKQIADFAPDLTAKDIGTVLSVGDGIARIAGLRNVMMSEKLDFGNGVYGMALNLEEDTIGAILFGASTAVKEGMDVRGTGEILSIPVGEALVGRVIDPLGNPLDGKPLVTKGMKLQQIERIAAGVIERQPVDTPLQTGIKAIDSMIPIGLGQRELIIGDRQTGKTAVAIDAVINQKGTGVICVYVAIGQKESNVARLVAKLKESGALEHTIIVVAGASHPASLQYLAPYAGCAVGEYFMEKGGNAMVVYDDLSKHAWSYRQISLLLRRPPGREAYPGDVFYLHSRLLERAVKLRKESGGGTLTALPIIETQAGDVSAYIPTNVISITDGQIYLESDLFFRGIRPAVNVGLSVSRVGGAAQIKAMKKVAGRLRLDLAQFRELEAFAQFATDLDEATKKQIERGRRIVEILKQGQYRPMEISHQVAIIYAVTNGFLDSVAITEVQKWEAGFHDYLENSRPDVLKLLREKKALDETVEVKLKEAINEYKKII